MEKGSRHLAPTHIHGAFVGLRPLARSTDPNVRAPPGGWDRSFDITPRSYVWMLATVYCAVMDGRQERGKPLFITALTHTSRRHLIVE